MLIKWVLVGVCVAVPAAALAYVGGPIADAGLAVLAVAVAFALVARDDRRLSGVRKSLERVGERNDQLRASVKQIQAENAALQMQLAKARSALEDKIALAVQRMHEKFKAELAAANRDSEVESGLDALNRYAALATQPANLVGDDSSPHHSAT